MNKRVTFVCVFPSPTRLFFSFLYACMYVPVNQKQLHSGNGIDPVGCMQCGVFVVQAREKNGGGFLFRYDMLHDRFFFRFLFFKVAAFSSPGIFVRSVDSCAEIVRMLVRCNLIHFMLFCFSFSGVRRVIAGEKSTCACCSGRKTKEKKGGGTGKIGESLDFNAVESIAGLVSG